MKKNKILAITIMLITMMAFGTIDVNAADTYAVKFPETVTRGPIPYAYTSGVANPSADKSSYPFYNEDTTGTYLLYCSDRNNPRYEHNDVLKKSSERLPYGYVKILSMIYEIDPIYGYVLDGTYKEYTNNEEMKKMTNTWITQMALWGYQGTITEGEINGDQLKYKINDSSTGTNTTKNEVLLFNSITKHNDVLVARDVWNRYVSPIIQRAKSAKEPSDAKIYISGDEKASWTASDNILKSSLIKVDADSGFEATLSSFSISLENAPEGTKVYTEDGTEVTDTTNITESTKLYVTIDKNKIDKSKEYNFKLNATGTISYDAAYMYTNDSGKQPSILIGPETKETQGSMDFKLIPDTASSLSKSIYYLGFIILLCGVGMIYANVRPKRQEEE